VRANYASVRRVSAPQIGSPRRSVLVVTVVGGYALFDESASRVEGTRPPPASERTDVRSRLAVKSRYALPSRWYFSLGLRAEVRDLYSGKPNYNPDVCERALSRMTLTKKDQYERRKG